MKLHCNFHYLKEVYSEKLEGVKHETVYIYEYSPKRQGFLKDKELILYAVVKANKDNYASDKNIKMGFYTKMQALEYAIYTYFQGRFRYDS